MSLLSIWLYLINLMSSKVISSIVFFLVRRRIFRRLEPVVDLTSCLMNERSCFGMSFLDFSIWLKNERNLSIRTFFKCFAWEIGSMRYLCVCIGRSNMIRTAVFHEFSNMIASRENKSHNGLPVKWKLWIRFILTFVEGWQTWNSWFRSIFFWIKAALLIFMSCLIPSIFVLMLLPRWMPPGTHGRGSPHSSITPGSIGLN